MQASNWHEEEAYDGFLVSEPVASFDEYGEPREPSRDTRRDYYDRPITVSEHLAYMSSRRRRERPEELGHRARLDYVKRYGQPKSVTPQVLDESPFVFGGTDSVSDGTCLSQQELLRRKARTSRRRNTAKSKSKKKSPIVGDLPSSLTRSREMGWQKKGGYGAVPEMGKYSQKVSDETFPETDSERNWAFSKVPLHDAVVNEAETVWLDDQVQESRSVGSASFPLLSQGAQQQKVQVAEEMINPPRQAVDGGSNLEATVLSRRVRFSSNLSRMRAIPSRSDLLREASESSTPWDEQASPSSVVFDAGPAPKSILRQQKYSPMDQRQLFPSNSPMRINHRGLEGWPTSPVSFEDRPLGHPAEKLALPFDRAVSYVDPRLQDEFPDPPLDMQHDDDSSAAMPSRVTFIQTVAAVVIQSAIRRFLARLGVVRMLELELHFDDTGALPERIEDASSRLWDDDESPIRPLDTEQNRNVGRSLRDLEITDVSLESGSMFGMRKPSNGQPEPFDIYGTSPVQPGEQRQLSELKTDIEQFSVPERNAIADSARLGAPYRPASSESSALRSRQRQQGTREQILAAIRIQSFFRGWWVRDTMGVDDYCATVIQTRFRKYSTRVSYRWTMYCVVHIQASVRRWIAREHLLRSQGNAVTIQALVRAFLVRKLFKELRSSQIRSERDSRYRQWSPYDAAAMKIQTRWRAFSAESHFIQDLVDVIIVQSVVRTWIAKRRIALLKKPGQVLATKRSLVSRNFRAASKEYSRGKVHQQKQPFWTTSSATTKFDSHRERIVPTTTHTILPSWSPRTSQGDPSAPRTSLQEAQNVKEYTKHKGGVEVSEQIGLKFREPARVHEVKVANAPTPASWSQKTIERPEWSSREGVGEEKVELDTKKVDRHDSEGHEIADVETALSDTTRNQRINGRSVWASKRLNGDGSVASDPSQKYGNKVFEASTARSHAANVAAALNAATGHKQPQAQSPPSFRSQNKKRPVVVYPTGSVERKSGKLFSASDENGSNGNHHSAWPPFKHEEEKKVDVVTGEASHAVKAPLRSPSPQDSHPIKNATVPTIPQRPHEGKKTETDVKKHSSRRGPSSVTTEATSSSTLSSTTKENSGRPAWTKGQGTKPVLNNSENSDARTSLAMKSTQSVCRDNGSLRPRHPAWSSSRSHEANVAAILKVALSEPPRRRHDPAATEARVESAIESTVEMELPAVTRVHDNDVLKTTEAPDDELPIISKSAKGIPESLNGRINGNGNERVLSMWQNMDKAHNY